MVTVNHLTKSLGNFTLNDISFSLPKGYILGLIGENGAGKTTLLRILARLYKQTDGELSLLPSPEEIGVVFHEEYFDGFLTLIQNGNYYGRFYSNYNQALLLSYLKRFSLNPKITYKKLSKGEKLTFALSFALAHQPKLLLLDEPGANFDTDFRKEFHKLLREYTANGEHSVILSTHITSDVEQFADYLLFLKNGSVRLFGDIETIRRSYRMVAGEEYLIRLLHERIMHMEENEYGCRALVKTSRKPFSKDLNVWEPSIEELMYHILKQKGEEQL